MIYVVATLFIKPETRAEFIAAATACINETRKEPGNIAYHMHESVTDPTKMVFVETWANTDANVPHRSTEHRKTFGRVAVKCMSAPPRIEIITPEKVEVRRKQDRQEEQERIQDLSHRHLSGEAGIAACLHQ